MTLEQAKKLKREIEKSKDPKNDTFYFNHYIVGTTTIDYKHALEAMKIYNL